MESSEILGFGMRTSALGTQISLAIGIQNPSSTDKESGIQYLESGIRNPESIAWNPESKIPLHGAKMYMCKIRALVEATFQRFFSPSYTIKLASKHCALLRASCQTILTSRRHSDRCLHQWLGPGT